jgi:ABC-type glycerol-3-phosphate transport system permease component
MGYAYVLPFFVVFAAFSIYPWLDTAWVSLHDVRLSTYDQMSWLGLGNYHNLFTNEFFWNAFRNTITIGIISTVPQLCMALGIAHLLNYRLRGRTFFRVSILMPYATSLAAATVIFLELFDPQLGLVNWVLHLAHLPAVDWQGSRWPSQVAVSTIVIWRWTGYNALIYLAGMQSIDTQLYDAAVVDGCGRWAQFRYVTLPGLRPHDPVHHRRLDDRCHPALRRAAALPLRQGRRRHPEPVPDPRPAHVPAGLVLRPARTRLGHGLDDVRHHRAGGARQRPARPPAGPCACRLDARRAAGQSSRRSFRRRRAMKAGAQLRGTRVTYVLLSVVTLVSVFPLYYTVVMASHTNAEMASATPPWTPTLSLFSNIKAALRLAPLNQGLVNSVFVSSVVTAGTVAFCTLAGFAFAKLRFRGANVLLAICIGTMMVPMQMGVIPLYMLMSRMGLAGHLAAVVLPNLVTAFGVFFMRQYISGAVPDELVEAGWIDGAGPLRVFWSVVVPAVRPAMAVLGMLTFLASWNDFFWPIIALSSQNPTIQVAFQSLATGYAPQQSIIMAGTLYGTVPVLVVFAVLGRQIVGGIMQGAVKG